MSHAVSQLKRSPRLALSLCVALALMMAWPLASAWTQPVLTGGDYGLENRGWNGLSRFTALAKALGYELEPRVGVDYGALGPTDRLIVLYPTRELDERQLSRFVIDGGRVILADDHGQAGPVLERLGISRESLKPSHHSRFLMDRPSLPVFSPGGKHPLLEDVEEVVANHPSVLRTEGGAILPYDDGRSGLVYDMRLGRGKVIVIGDASLMINHMLSVRDNRRFLENALNYLCLRADPCKPYLLVGDAELTGRYVSKNSRDDSMSDALSESLTSFNRLLEDLAATVPHREALYYVSLLLMVGLVVFMMTVFSWRRSPDVAPDVGPPPHIRPLSEFEWNLLRFNRGGFQANYALPMSILKTEFERLFYTALGDGEAVPAPDDPMRPAFLKRMAQRYVERHEGSLKGRARARSYKRVLQLLVMFSRIPPRHRLFLDSEAYFNEREMLKIYARSRAILDAMGLGQDYERRTDRRERGRAARDQR